MNNQFKIANLYIESMKCVIDNELFWNKYENTMRAAICANSLNSFKNLSLQKKAMVKIALRGSNTKEYDLLIKKIAISVGGGVGGLKDVAVGADFVKNRIENASEGGGVTENIKEDFITSAAMFIPVVGGGMALWDLYKEINKDTGINWINASIDLLIITADVVLIGSIATKKVQWGAGGIGLKVASKTLKTLLKAAELTSTDRFILSKFGKQIIGIIEGTAAKRIKVINKMPFLSPAKKSQATLEIEKTMQLCVSKIKNTQNVKGFVKNLVDDVKAISKVRSSTNGVPYYLAKTTNGKDLIMVSDSLALLPNRPGMATEFNLVKIKINGGKAEIIQDLGKAGDDIIARNELALEALTKGNWVTNTNPIGNINMTKLERTHPNIKKILDESGVVKSPLTIGVGALAIGVVGGTAITNAVVNNAGSLINKGIDAVTPGEGGSAGTSSWLAPTQWGQK